MMYFWILTLQRRIEGAAVVCTVHASKQVDLATGSRSAVFESVLAEARDALGVPEYEKVAVLFYSLQPDRLGLPS